MEQIKAELHEGRELTYNVNMFCLDPIHPIYNAILDTVTRNPGITMGELYTKIRERRVDTSLQHLYRTVNRLLDEQTIIKEKGTLRANLMWTSALTLFAEQARESALEYERKNLALPLKNNARKTFDADTLQDVQAIWHHLLIQLYRHAPEKHLFKYYSHAWWFAMKNALDVEFYRAIEKKGVECHWLFGQRTWLTQFLLTKAGLDWRIAKESVFPLEGYNLNVYGEYIVECIFPDIISRHLALLFKTVTKESEYDQRLFQTVFDMKVKYHVTLWHNAKQAAALRKNIARFFLPGGER